MIVLYSYSITDFQGESIIYSSKKYTSAKQAAFLATKEKNSIPPASGIRIHKHIYDAKQIARIINERVALDEQLFQYVLEDGWINLKKVESI